MTKREFHDDPEASFYHSGSGPRPRKRVYAPRKRRPDLAERTIIAWDSEGINIQGPEKPQHLVIFGCSADSDNPLIAKDIHTGDALRYICDIGARFPHAVHIGYGFRYDANMIIRHLPIRCLAELKEKGETYYDWQGCRYRVAWLPGKRFQVTRRRNGIREVTVTIDDIISFFASSFIKATESILADELTDDDREVIAHGKAERGNNTWDDLPDILRYWTAEIRLMQRLAVKFREVMYESGFMLRNWYGPGALSSYIINTRGLRRHIVNGPPELPSDAHQASKRAYAGGRFELFRIGRFANGPVYSLDINSAYPYAISQAPGLGVQDGFWQYVENPDRIAYFGVYRIRFHAPNASCFEPRPMPLFHRDYKGTITYPNVVHGWYWSPEAASVANRPGVEICEAWEWVPREPELRPFSFLADMYAERMRIGKRNVMSMPYKLGPNSLYGKFAQRIGWVTDNNGAHHPPRSHCLPLAGWVTSYTRAMLYSVLRNVPWDTLIAVETDGIYMTTDPTTIPGLRMGDGLGEWDVSHYNELLYLQSGIYHRRVGEEWLPPKSRGLDTASVSLPVVREYLRACRGGVAEWPGLPVTLRPRFVGLTAAMAGNAPVKVRHCRWEPGERILEPGGKGKRVHFPNVCRACHEGHSAWDAGHTLIIRSRSDGSMSYPHFLPWEGGEQYEETATAEALDRIDEDMTL